MSAELGVAVQNAVLRQNITVSLIKQVAQQEQAIANLVDSVAQSVPVSSSRGGNVNIRA